MVQSPVFWAVLLLSVPVFWLLSEQLRMGFLAVVSFGYLVTLEPVSVCVLSGWVTMLFHLFPVALATGRLARLAVLAAIVAPLTYLAYFKYLPPLVAALATDAVAPAWIVPLGLSYFTFKLIHYAVEVSRGNIKECSFQRFCCYIFCFPIFVAGPIERFDHFQLNQERTWQLQSTVEGSMRIVYGLIKKFVVGGFILDCFGSVNSAEMLVRHLPSLSTAKLWYFFILSFLYAYTDFSAYSDIAIGASRLFGLRIAENFNFPLLAQNIAEFWKRWHMTLSGWCQAYVYMPMIGLTRNPYLAIYSAFFVMGLWHAASPQWILWGLYNATGVSVFIAWSRWKRKRAWTFLDWRPFSFAGTVMTFLFVSSGGAFTVLHGVADCDTSFQVLLKLFSMGLRA